MNTEGNSMISFRQKILLLLFITGILCAGFLPARTNAQSIDIKALIESLQKQVDILKQQLDSLRETSSPLSISFGAFDGIPGFSVYLERGMSGEAVRNLQIFLKQFPSFYPEGLVTEYFGSLTEEAVKRFQKTYGIDQLGVVGPRTREKLNEILFEQKKVGTQVEISAVPLSPVTQATSSPVVESHISSSQFFLEPKPLYDTNALAQLIHTFINEERAKQGLSPLAWDWGLAQVAFLHSADQARDNEDLTDPDVLCHYPLIRHEGFSFGFSLKDRLTAKNISFRSAGENIGMLPASTNLIYQFSEDTPPLPCLIVPEFETSAQGTPEERTALYQQILSQSRAASFGQKPVEWVNRSWHTEHDLARRIVDGWMNSPGHRSNILTAGFTADGIGVISIHDYFIITHDFVGR